MTESANSERVGEPLTDQRLQEIARWCDEYPTNAAQPIVGALVAELRGTREAAKVWVMPNLVARGTGAMRAGLNRALAAARVWLPQEGQRR